MSFGRCLLFGWGELPILGLRAFVMALYFELLLHGKDFLS